MLKTAMLAPPVLLKNEFFDLTVWPSFGCRWASLKVSTKNSWHDLLWPSPAAPEQTKKPFDYGAYLMAPWCNRFPNAEFLWEGTPVKVRPNFPDGSAIHGDVMTREWKIERSRQTSLSATFDSRQTNDFNFPFPMLFHHKVELKGNEMRATLSVENKSDENAPVGFGIHPFFLKEVAGAGLRLSVPAEEYYPSESAVPTGPSVPVTPDTDLRAGVDADARYLDGGYTQLKGRPIVLNYAGAVQVEMRPDAAMDHVFVYSPRDNRRVICVEPMTHAVNGFNLAERGWKETGVKILKPDEIFEAGVTLAVLDGR